MRYSRYSQFGLVRLIEEVLGVLIYDRVDLGSIDISQDGVFRVLETLTPREATVLRLRFLGGLTLEETGKRLKSEIGRSGTTSRDRVSQLQAKALRKMRHPSRIRMLNSCIVGTWRLGVDPWLLNRAN